jgi:flagellar hook-length control protein FliK
VISATSSLGGSDTSSANSQAAGGPTSGGPVDANGFQLLLEMMGMLTPQPGAPQPPSAQNSSQNSSSQDDSVAVGATSATSATAGAANASGTAASGALNLQSAADEPGPGDSPPVPSASGALPATGPATTVAGGTPAGTVPGSVKVPELGTASVPGVSGPVPPPAAPPQTVAPGSPDSPGLAASTAAAATTSAPTPTADASGLPLKLAAGSTVPTVARNTSTGKSDALEQAQSPSTDGGANQTTRSSTPGGGGHNDDLADKQQPTAGDAHQIAGKPADATNLINPSVFSAPSAPNQAVATTSAPADPSPSPAKQVATVVAPFALRPDGSYTLSIKLTPDGLGDVRIDLKVQAGVVDLQLHASGGETADLLRQNLDGLRQQLTDAGFTSANVGVGVGGQSQDQWQNPQHSAGSPSTRPSSTNTGNSTGTTVGPGARANVPHLNDSSVLDLQL